MVKTCLMAAFVMVEEPQTKTALPPMMAVTSRALAVVRFHGRRTETWEAKGIPVVERFRYLYHADELGEWVPRIRQAAGSVKNLHLLMKNCYANYGATNARRAISRLRLRDHPAVTGTKMPLQPVRDDRCMVTTTAERLARPPAAPRRTQMWPL